jgi:hypothetical protein
MVVVKGTAADGSAVTATATSGADGSWAVQVPAGSYAAGPSDDGTAIDGRGFDPPRYQGAVNGDRFSLNFLTCAGPGPGASTANNVSAQVHRASTLSQGRLLSAPAADICKSTYVVTLKAHIPQTYVVDPSLRAPYNTAQVPTEDGYNGQTSSWNQLVKRLHLESVPDLSSDRRHVGNCWRPPSVPLERHHR